MLRLVRFTRSRLSVFPAPGVRQRAKAERFAQFKTDRQSGTTRISSFACQAAQADCKIINSFSARSEFVTGDRHDSATDRRSRNHSY
jgi:hypothetical protein